MRVALNDAAPLYRDAPEAQAEKVEGERIFHTFMQEVLADASQETRALASDLITTTFSTVGKDFSESPHTSSEISTYSEAMADMFCAYLTELARH